MTINKAVNSLVTIVNYKIVDDTVWFFYINFIESIVLIGTYVLGDYFSLLVSCSFIYIN